LKARILLTLVLAYSTSCSQEWVPVVTSEDKTTEVFVDASSVRVTDDIRTASIRTLFAPHTTHKTFGSNANKWESYLLTRLAFNCSNKTFKLEALTAYYEDETHESVPAERIADDWEPVVPGHLLDSELQFVCAWKSG
jgi:hypothetical protein